MAQSAIPSLRDGVRILFRQKYRVALTAIAILALTVLAILFLPRSYISEAKLYIRIGREDLAVDPLATFGETLTVSADRTGEIKSLTQILQSRGVMEAVVQKIGADTILNQDLPGDPGSELDAPLLVEAVTGTLGGALDWASNLLEGPIGDDERAVKQLLDSVEVDSEKKANVISVLCKSGSPRLAQRIVEEVVAEFQKRHIEAHQSQGSFAFFDTQRDRVKQQLAAASQRLSDEKNDSGVVSVDVERAIIQADINNINSTIAAVSASLAESSAKVAKLKRQFPGASEGLDKVALLPEQQVATGTSSNALDQMRSTLFALQLKDRELASRYFEEHPERVAIRDQLQDAEIILAEQEILLETSNIGNWESRLGALDTKMTEAHGKLRDLNRTEMKVNKAKDEVDRINKIYLSYEENLEVARIDEALEQQRLTNVRVVQDATLQYKSVSPKKFLLAALGIMGAFVGSIGVGVGSEYLDPTLKTNDEVEAELEMPVLVSIPRMARHRVQMH